MKRNPPFASTGSGPAGNTESASVVLVARPSHRRRRTECPSGARAAISSSQRHQQGHDRWAHRNTRFGRERSSAAARPKARPRPRRQGRSIGARTSKPEPRPGRPAGWGSERRRLASEQGQGACCGPRWGQSPFGPCSRSDGTGATTAVQVFIRGGCSWLSPRNCRPRCARKPAWLARAHGIPSASNQPSSARRRESTGFVPGQALATLHGQHPAAGCHRQQQRTSTGAPRRRSSARPPSTTRLRRESESARVGVIHGDLEAHALRLSGQREVSNLRRVQPVMLPASMCPSSRPEPARASSRFPCALRSHRCAAQPTPVRAQRNAIKFDDRGGAASERMDRAKRGLCRSRAARA